MQSSVYVGVSSQLNLRQKLDVVANNVANMNTIGFRSEEVRFEEVVSRSGLGDTSFSGLRGVHYSSSSGAAILTKNPTDLMIIGDGWFSVSVMGDRGFTRDGRFQMSGGGELKTVYGASVLDAGGSPIVLDPDGPQPIVGRDGTITQNGAVVATVGLFRMQQDAILVRSGPGMMVSDQPGIPVTDFRQYGIVQGSIEGSNVNPIKELTSLIMVQRVFESVTGSIQAQEDTLGEAIRLLGPVR